MKKVFKAEQVIALFADQTQDHARTPTNNLYFHGDVLFSYGEHWPLAKIIGNVALVNSKHSSVTTNKHASMAMNALADHYTVLPVPNVLADTRTEHEENITHLLRERIKYEGMAERARSVHMIESHSRLARMNDTRYHYYTGLTQGSGVFADDYRQAA